MGREEKLEVGGGRQGRSRGEERGGGGSRGRGKKRQTSFTSRNHAHLRACAATQGRERRRADALRLLLRCAPIPRRKILDCSSRSST